MSLRLFAALAVPDEIAERLLALQKGVPGARWRPRENLHVTLRFYGEVAEPVAEEIDGVLEEIAQATPPFEIELKGAGAFGKDAPHTLWIGVADNPVLAKLASDCERAARRIGLRAEPRKFAPHITLAYLNNPEIERVHAFESRLGLFRTPPFRVEAFGLYSSHLRKSAPGLYRLEADYPLRG